MTASEISQAYSNLCVRLGDHISKARQHDYEARQISIEIDKLMKEKPEEEKVNDTQKS